MRTTHNCSFDNPLVCNQCGFDFHRTQAMTRHFYDIVYTTHDPEITIHITVRTVASHIKSIVEFSPIGSDIPFIVTPDCTQHGWPWLANNQVTTSIRGGNAVALIVDDISIDSGQCPGA